jgi:5'-nucleotidase
MGLNRNRRGKFIVRHRIWALAALMLALLVVAPSAFATGPKQKDNDQHVKLLAINDFHGNLEPPSGSSGCIPIAPATSTATCSGQVPAGGAEYLATHLKQLGSQDPNTFVVAAGDSIGASPLLSGLFHDEPTIEALNVMGMDVSGVGNHEFDEGIDELLRMQNGGCHPIDGCQDGTPFLGSLFQYLAANVLYAGTQNTVLPAYEIKKVGNAKIAFIGLTLEGTPLIVTPAGVAGLEFTPEVMTVNRFVKQLREDEGVRSVVVLIHEGGQQNAPFAGGFMDINRCDNFSGAIKPIVEALDPGVDLVISAHTHQPYMCNFNGIPTTSASSFGRLITDIDLTIDHQSKDVTAVDAHNVIVTRDVPKDPDITAIINHYNTFAAPIANRVIGSITANITRSAAFNQESALGDVIADAQLASTSPTDFGGAVVAFMNPGGIRNDLTYNNSPAGEAPGQITYSEMFNVQPFNNVMNVKTMSGASIYRVLEQQFGNPTATAIKLLQVSNGFTYSYDFTRPAGSRVTPGSVAINGVPITATGTYRVAMNNFLSSGGDGFAAFNEGTDQIGGEIDIDAAVNYFLKHSPIAPGPRDRVTRLG